MRALVTLLVVLILISCGKQEQPLVINWEAGKAVSVSLNRSLLPADHVPTINVSGSQYHVLCTVSTNRNAMVFTPAVPFERGQVYDVMLGSKSIHSFEIPVDSLAQPPKVLASFPSCDTVPENLLKVYLTFDQPMMEGRAYEFIRLINRSTGDTVAAAFLDLEPELWSEDGKSLTLWLDPGRIKQDLIPNKVLGSVLTKNSRYELVVLPGWRSKAGLALNQVYRRTYVAGERDSERPDLRWKVSVDGSVVVDLGETLDWSLLTSAISVWKGDGEISGSIGVENCERRIRFTPEAPLKAGNYRIEVQSRLEDLAGNNLNRLFETDVTAETPVSKTKSVHTIAFSVY